MKSLTEVISEFPPHILSRYDFSGAEYHGALKPITGIVCPSHGEFQQYSAQLRKDGSGCPKCGHESRGLKRRLDHDDFIRRAEDIHPGRFTYENTHYVNMTTKVSVTCRHHGDFSISPIKLVHGLQGCPVCANSTRGKRKNVSASAIATAKTKIDASSKNYESRAKAVHGDKYGYDTSEYSGMSGHIKIACRVHGWVDVHAGHHLYNLHGCPRCGQKSAPEEEVASFLSIFTTVERRNRTLISPKEVDIYLPEHRIAVEFCGMYWHSHGDRDDERKNKLRHAEKHRMCAEKGVRLITIYETEWQDRKETIKRLLRNAIGKTKGRLMARKCTIREVHQHDARAFYDKYHPQGGSGHGEHLGLYWCEKLVACMRFTFGSNDRGHGAKSRQWTLSRYASRVSVAGAAGRLFKAFLDKHYPESVKSFSDNRLFSGGMYAQLGFDLEKDVPPDYQVWSQKAGLLAKPQYQRRCIPARLIDHGMDDRFDPDTDPRTEAEMTYLMGARRIYDCGKKRWVWSKKFDGTSFRHAVH